MECVLYTHSVSRIEEQRTEFVQLLQCNDCSFLLSQRGLMNLRRPFRPARPCIDYVFLECSFLLQ